VPAEFFVDPRYAALGQRAVLETEVAAKLLEKGASELSAYHLWRMCCAVPEGPIDLPVDKALPLNGNLDLLNFISFKKGCYLGQELTMRTKHRGAVRQRFFQVVSSREDPQKFVDELSLDPSAPLLPADLRAAEGSALPSFETAELAAENDAARAVEARKKGSDAWKSAGVLHSAAHNVGLCLLRGSQAMNWAENLKDMPLDAGTELAVQGVPLGLRPPPYVFLSSQAVKP
jgi:folate-binding protein YgfZ